MSPWYAPCCVQPPCLAHISPWYAPCCVHPPLPGPHEPLVCPCCVQPPLPGPHGLRGAARPEVAAMAPSAAATPDPLFHGRLFAALADLGLDDLLLRLPQPASKDIEMFLRTAGGTWTWVHHQ